MCNIGFPFLKKSEMERIIKNKCLAIFNRPVTLPGDNWEKETVYGLVLEADPNV